MKFINFSNGKGHLAGMKRNIICFKRREYIKAYDTKRGGILKITNKNILSPFSWEQSRSRYADVEFNTEKYFY